MDCRPKSDNGTTKILSRNKIDHQSPVLPVSLQLFDNHREPSFTAFEKKQTADFDYQRQLCATLSLEYKSFMKSLLSLSPVTRLIDQKIFLTQRKYFFPMDMNFELYLFHQFNK